MAIEKEELVEGLAVLEAAAAAEGAGWRAETGWKAEVRWTSLTDGEEAVWGRLEVAVPLARPYMLRSAATGSLRCRCWALLGDRAVLATPTVAAVSLPRQS